jgi:hypothetical protein
MQPSTSSGKESYSTTKHIPSILWKPKVYYFIHKNTSLVLILSQINSVHSPIRFLEHPFHYYSLIYVYSPLAETRQRKQSKPRVATADSKEWTKRAVSSVYSLHSDAR